MSFGRLAVAAALALLLAVGADGAQLDEQKSSVRGVTVSVIPQDLSPAAASWDFKVVLDTHSQDLNDDLLKSTVLVDNTGGRHTPTSWEGAAPGGHHREGLLKFKPWAPPPAQFELHISRPGEPKPRVYRWKID